MPGLTKKIHFIEIDLEHESSTFKSLESVPKRSLRRKQVESEQLNLQPGLAGPVSVRDSLHCLERFWAESFTCAGCTVGRLLPGLSQQSKAKCDHKSSSHILHTKHLQEIEREIARSAVALESPQSAQQCHRESAWKQTENPCWADGE